MLRISVPIIALMLAGIGGPASAGNDGSNTEPEIIRIAAADTIYFLDPVRSIWTGSLELFGQLYSRVLRRDPENQLQPGLAHAWEISPDGLQYTFHLRPALFSDGTPISADDVAFSWLRLRDHPESAWPEGGRVIKHAEALDELTLQVTLIEPAADFLVNTELVYFSVVSRADVEARGEEQAFLHDTVTSGPYRVALWKQNVSMELEPNAHYWREGFPRNDGVLIREGIDVQTRISMLLAGEVDAVRGIPWSQVELLRAEPSVLVPHEPSNMIWVVLINHARPPFNDIRVRQAAALALDREALGRVMMRGIGTVANTTLPRSLNFHHTEYPGWPYDPGRARALMEAAGAVGSEAVIKLTAPSARSEQIALVLQSQWAAVGINSRIVKADQALTEAAIEGGDYDANITWWYNETPDAGSGLKWATCGTCGNRSYYTNYQNDEVDRLLAVAGQSMNPEERREIYYRVQEISTEEVSQIPLFYPPWLNAYSTGIEGLRLSPGHQWTLEYARRLP